MCSNVSFGISVFTNVFQRILWLSVLIQRIQLWTNVSYVPLVKTLSQRISVFTNVFQRILWLSVVYQLCNPKDTLEHIGKDLWLSVITNVFQRNPLA